MHSKCGSCINRVLLFDLFSIMCCWMGETFSRNELCSFWVTCCVLLKEEPCLNGAGLELAGLLGSREEEQGQGSGQGVWTRNTDSLFSPLTSFCSRLFCSLVGCCNIQVMRNAREGGVCGAFYILFICCFCTKKRCLRLMVLNRKYIFCFKTSSEFFNRTPLQFTHSIYTKLSLNKSAVLASKVFKK